MGCGLVVRDALWGFTVADCVCVGCCNMWCFVWWRAVVGCELRARLCVGLCLLLVNVCGVWLRCFEFCVGAWLLVRVGGGFRCRF